MLVFREVSAAVSVKFLGSLSSPFPGLGDDTWKSEVVGSDSAEALLGNEIGSSGDVMLKREVFLEASGFNKHYLQMLVQGNTMYVMGMAVTPLGLRLIHDEVKVDADFLYDAHNVVAELSSGILKVTLPTGTKETMMAEPFPIKWLEEDL
ncbi:hypothetical protein Tco_0307709, partial [Tanacetum coccineum]